ncbi:hypothetical protein [Ruminococcus sp.]|uniref:hypothetical protein n=1 Tax=Ruminococcus sp. TaxID=41978 RepID=UPI00258DE03D|nr:hypothetical protein [Ruminococcus sp.]
MAQENINITEQELDASVCELQDIIPDDVNDYDIVVVGQAQQGSLPLVKQRSLALKSHCYKRNRALYLRATAARL